MHLPGTAPETFSSIVNYSEMIPCHDPQQVGIGYMADLQVMSLRILQKMMNGLTHLRCSSTDLDDGQIRVLQASPLYLQEGTKCGPITSSSLCKRKLGVKFISSSEEYGDTRCVVFKQKQVESRSIFRQRRFFLRTSTGFPGNNEPLFRFSNPENSTKSPPEEHRDQMLAEAKSEVRKQESRTDFLDSSVRDLHRQLDSNRLEIHCINQGHKESRQEQN